MADDKDKEDKSVRQISNWFCGGGRDSEYLFAKGPDHSSQNSQASVDPKCNPFVEVAGVDSDSRGGSVIRRLRGKRAYCQNEAATWEIAKQSMQRALTNLDETKFQRLFGATKEQVRQTLESLSVSQDLDQMSDEGFSETYGATKKELRDCINQATGNHASINNDTKKRDQRSDGILVGHEKGRQVCRMIRYIRILAKDKGIYDPNVSSPTIEAARDPRIIKKIKKIRSFFEK